MGSLNQTDLEVLQDYANRGMRERYWNYLASHDGSDGYGKLALAVVRNDAMPGAIANNYAQSYVKDHPVNGKTHLSEREWEKVGVDLIRADIEQRQAFFQQGRQDLALNLPVAQVYFSHVKAFEQNGIDRHAWTPAVLIDASYQHAGNMQQSEEIWHDMLHSNNQGMNRLGSTLKHQWDNDKAFDRYTLRQTAAAINASLDHPYNTPNTIMNAGHLYTKNQQGEWQTFQRGKVGGAYLAVHDSAKIHELNDISQMRENRNEQSAPENRNRKDPFKDILWSEKTIVDNRDMSNGILTVAEHNLTVNASVMDIINHAYLAAKSDNPDKAFDQALANIAPTSFAGEVKQEAKELTASHEVAQQALVQQQAEEQVINSPVVRGPVMKM